MKALRLAILPALVLIANCTMIPKYQRPDPAVATKYATQTQANQGNQLASDIGWREYYADPRLQKLIGLALRNNRDLRVAILNIDAAAAQYRIQRADLLPTVSASASGSVQRLPAD